MEKSNDASLDTHKRQKIFIQAIRREEWGARHLEVSLLDETNRPWCIQLERSPRMRWADVSLRHVFPAGFLSNRVITTDSLHVERLLVRNWLIKHVLAVYTLNAQRGVLGQHNANNTLFYLSCFEMLPSIGHGHWWMANRKSRWCVPTSKHGSPAKTLKRCLWSTLDVRKGFGSYRAEVRSKGCWGSS